MESTSFLLFLLLELASCATVVGIFTIVVTIGIFHIGFVYGQKHIKVFCVHRLLLLLCLCLLMDSDVLQCLIINFELCCQRFYLWVSYISLFYASSRSFLFLSFLDGIYLDLEHISRTYTKFLWKCFFFFLNFFVKHSQLLIVSQTANLTVSMLFYIFSALCSVTLMTFKS